MIKPGQNRPGYKQTDRLPGVGSAAVPAVGKAPDTAEIKEIAHLNSDATKTDAFHSKRTQQTVILTPRGMPALVQAGLNQAHTHKDEQTIATQGGADLCLQLVNANNTKTWQQMRLWIKGLEEEK